jgi:hypothetical protein
MKFGKAYTEYIERESHSHLLGCSYVEFKRLKKVLKRCPLHLAQCHQTRAPVSTALISSTPLVDDGRALLSNGPHDEKTEADAVTTSHASQEVSLCCPGSCHSWIMYCLILLEMSFAFSLARNLVMCLQEIILMDSFSKSMLVVIVGCTSLISLRVALRTCRL